MTDQVVFSDAGFVVQGIHTATKKVNLSQQLHMLRETDRQLVTLSQYSLHLQWLVLAEKANKQDFVQV